MGEMWVENVGVKDLGGYAWFSLEACEDSDRVARHILGIVSTWNVVVRLKVLSSLHITSNSLLLPSLVGLWGKLGPLRRTAGQP